MKKKHQNIPSLIGVDDYQKYMKFGLFYYNPNDLRVFVTSYRGKTTVNFARWQARVVFFGVIALAIIGTYFL